MNAMTRINYRPTEERNRQSEAGAPAHNKAPAHNENETTLAKQLLFRRSTVASRAEYHLACQSVNAVAGDDLGNLEHGGLSGSRRGRVGSGHLADI